MHDNKKEIKNDIIVATIMEFLFSINEFIVF